MTVPQLQPNFVGLAQHLKAIAQEIALIPNLPAFNSQLQLYLLQDQVRQQTQELQEVKLQLAQMETLLPIRLQNAAASLHAPLVYPPGLNLPPVAPVRKQDLLQLDAVACQVLADALGLPPLQSQAAISIVDQRQQIIDYLGAALSNSLIIS